MNGTFLGGFLSPTSLFALVVLLGLALFFYYYKKATDPRRGTLEWIEESGRPKVFSLFRRHPMEKSDLLPLFSIVCVYAVIAFLWLGNTVAPQSFHTFSQGDKLTIELSEEMEIGHILYYSGLWTGSYELCLEAEDGSVFETTMKQSHGIIFYWLYVDGEKDEVSINARAKTITITASPDRGRIALGEMALFDKDGNLIPLEYLIFDRNSAVLFDEQEFVPARPTFLNSAYFDEIYHARTAYEHLKSVTPYEITHPPLGKIFISIGISLFGMTPFGWRFVGVIFGILMLPFMYIFLKNLFGKRIISICGTLLFAFDFMHYTQTRIATIDTYSVFFIILMYFFMYRYISEDYDAPFRKTLLPLALCGLSFGVGAAAKWTSIYAGAGLLALYIIHLIRRYRHNKRQGEKSYWPFLLLTLSASLVFFILLPAVIYYLSYIPYGRAQGMVISEGMLTSREYFRTVIENQTYMFTYHKGVNQAHGYASRWYQWIFNLRPILYYRSYVGNSAKSAFAAFMNPIVCWGGLMAMVSLFISFIKRRDMKALFIIIGYFSQLAPWFIIGRTTFAYHYFPSMIFLVLALSYVLDVIWTRGFWKYKTLVLGFTGAALFLFILFYPVLSGLTVPRWYTTHILRWFSSWPF